MLRIASEDRGEWNRRFGLSLDDGAQIESVLYRGDTLCVSCQVGCAVRCPFCASGADGLGRSLTLDEMLGQVATIEAVLAGEAGPKLRGVTISGIGEPLHNADVVARFADACRARGLRVTLTTSGGTIPRLREWLVDRPHHGLTVSVHAGSEAVRARVVPHGPALGALFSTLAAGVPALSHGRRKRTALAYLLLADVNDTATEIDAFVARALPLGLAVHLYAHNPVATSPWHGLDRARYEEVYARMKAAGVTVRMSARARLEPNGGCGTLVARARASPQPARRLAVVL